MSVPGPRKSKNVQRKQWRAKDKALIWYLELMGRSSCLNCLLATGQALLDADSTEHHRSSQNKGRTWSHNTAGKPALKTAKLLLPSATGSGDDIDSDVEPGARAWDNRQTQVSDRQRRTWSWAIGSLRGMLLSWTPPEVTSEQHWGLKHQGQMEGTRKHSQYLNTLYPFPAQNRHYFFLHHAV